MSTVYIKIAIGLVAALLTYLGFKSYASKHREIGREEGRNEMREVMDEKFTELADDVLNGPHPYSVSEDSVAEISSSRADSEGGVASDVQREGGEGRPSRNGNASS